MADYTRPATWEDVKCVARYLDEAGVEYALIGGYALAAHGLVRMTEDIDVLVDPSAANSRKWVVALSRLRKSWSPIPTSFARRKTWEELRPFIEEVTLEGERVRVLSLEGLLKTKSGARPKDQADAAAIARALEELAIARAPLA